MSEPFFGQIGVFAFSFAPKGYAQCTGQILPIAQNQALFSLLGTQFGGDGQTTFALPNLQGCAPLGANATYPQGAAGGEASHALSVGEMPSHNHMLSASSAVATTSTPSSSASLAEPSVTVGGTTIGVSIYGKGTSQSNLNAAALSNAGASAGHENRQPYLAVTFAIALTGIYPSRP